ncbi:hypothetical protein RJT34_16375 [Clitoria ternatea]|uniref:PPM-type phosphatase domain-containing protein n=1 Tax=Clitoria ternatea TaxID=43366 RepID=A0AAN9PC93_CLITE
MREKSEAKKEGMTYSNLPICYHYQRKIQFRKQRDYKRKGACKKRLLYSVGEDEGLGEDEEVGDFHAVISSGGVVEALTSDHKPSREDERDTIETLGGSVDMCHGVWRIQGSLTVSRGIGDRHLK